MNCYVDLTTKNFLSHEMGFRALRTEPRMAALIGNEIVEKCFGSCLAYAATIYARIPRIPIGTVIIVATTPFTTIVHQQQAAEPLQRWLLFVLFLESVRICR